MHRLNMSPDQFLCGNKELETEDDGTVVGNQDWKGLSKAIEVSFAMCDCGWAGGLTDILGSRI